MIEPRHAVVAGAVLLLTDACALSPAPPVTRPACYDIVLHDWYEPPMTPDRGPYGVVTTWHSAECP